MLNALRPAVGASAVMCVPHLMTNLPKLWLQAPGGAVLSLFQACLRCSRAPSGEIWGSVLVQRAVALATDTSALLRKSAWHQQWGPR